MTQRERDREILGWKLIPKKLRYEQDLLSRASRALLSHYLSGREGPGALVAGSTPAWLNSKSC